MGIGPGFRHVPTSSLFQPARFALRAVREGFVMGSTIGKTEVGMCDACRRDEQQVENISRSGMLLKICVNFRNCIKNQPTIDQMARGVRR